MKYLNLPYNTQIRPIQETVDGERVSFYIESLMNERYFQIHTINFNNNLVLIDDHHKAVAFYILRKTLNVRVLESSDEILKYKKGIARYPLDYLLKIVDAKLKDLSDPRLKIFSIKDIFVFLRNKDLFKRTNYLSLEELIN